MKSNCVPASATSALLRLSKTSVQGVTQVYEKPFDQRWSRSTIYIAATCSRRRVDKARWLTDNGATGQRCADLSGHSDLFDPPCTYPVLCDAKVGLTKAHVKQLGATHHEERVGGDCEPRCATMQTARQ